MFLIKIICPDTQKFSRMELTSLIRISSIRISILIKRGNLDGKIPTRRDRLQLKKKRKRRKPREKKGRKRMGLKKVERNVKEVILTIPSTCKGNGIRKVLNILKVSNLNSKRTEEVVVASKKVSRIFK